MGYVCISYAIEDADKVELEALGAEGMEISVPARGSARTIVRDMIKHVCSSISYGGAASLGELREMFWKEPRKFLIKQSASASAYSTTGSSGAVVTTAGALPLLCD